MENKIIITALLIVLLSTLAIANTQEIKSTIQKTFQDNFNKDISPIFEKNWNINYLSYEEGITTNIKTINNNELEIQVTNTNGQGYKFKSAICNISNANQIEKFEYNPQTDTFASTGNLNYEKLTDYGLSSNWCNETNGYGFVLFSSTSNDKKFRLKFQEGEKNFMLITGSNSEVVNISFSDYEVINGVTFAKFTDVNYNKPITMVKLE